MRIKFNSDLSFLYDSIMAILVDQLITVFNSVLSKELITALITMANDNLVNQGTNTWAEGSVNIDQRWVLVTVNEMFIQAYSPG